MNNELQAMLARQKQKRINRAEVLARIENDKRYPKPKTKPNALILTLLLQS